MPLEYSVDPDLNLLVTTATGSMDDGQVLAYMRRIIADPRWRSGMNGLVDARGIEGFEVTSAAIAESSELAAKGENRFAGSRWAIVTDDDAVFGMTRMFTLRRDPESHQIRVFRERGEALAWLVVSGPKAD